MVPDCKTNTVYFSDQLANRHPRICHQLVDILEEQGVCWGFIRRTKDIWARDYMPVQLERGRFVKFRYTPDYLRGYTNLITGDEVLEVVGAKGVTKKSKLILDGGNIVSLGRQVALTDKVYKENPWYTRYQVRSKLHEDLESDHMVIIPKEPYDVIGHADGVIRMIEEGIVLINEYRLIPYYRDKLVETLQDAGLEFEFMPHIYTPSKGDLPSAVGIYLNYLRVGNLIIVPVFGLPEDETAVYRIEDLFPHATVKAVRAEELAEEGGVFNCISWNIVE
jgi:agmatine deiminase